MIALRTNLTSRPGPGRDPGPKFQKTRNAFFGVRRASLEFEDTFWLSVGWKKIQNSNGEELLKPRAAPKRHPPIRASMQASCLLCFGFASAAPDKFSAYPFRSPEPFRYAAVFCIFCSRIRHPSACTTFCSDIFLFDWKVIPWILWLESCQPRWSQCQHCQIYFDIRDIKSSRHSIGFASQGRVLRFCCSFGNEFRNCIVLRFLISAWFTVANRTQSSIFYPHVEPVLNRVSDLIHDERTSRGM